MKRPDSVIFEQVLKKLTPEQLIKYLEKYNFDREQQVKEQINKMKHLELQTKVEGLNRVNKCPYCGSDDYVKNGWSNHLQRYLCKNCKSTFSVVTNTFMEDTNWTWEQWRYIVHMTLTGGSINEIVDTLEKDYGLTGITHRTVFLARHKVIYAMSLMPKPKLSGIIQADEVYFRENQKGTRTDKGKNLINVIPQVIPYRMPRRRKEPSRLGIMGPEYACVVCAVDNNNNAISIVTSLGRLTPETFTDAFDEYFHDVTYFCTDKSPIYKNYCELKKISHYVRPSSFIKSLQESGYVTNLDIDDLDEVLNKVYTENKRIANKLYNEGLLDYLDYGPNIPFAEFTALKKQYGLNLARVNQFHSYLKLRLEKEMTGVATKYLPIYVDALTFMYNWRHAHKTTLSSMKDAEIILTELIKDNNAFTLNDIKKKEFFIAPQPSGRYMKLLQDKTAEMRRYTDNKFFKFDNEDRIISFDIRKYVKDTPVGKLRPIGKKYGISRYTKMTHWELYSAIMALPKDQLAQAVCDLIANDKDHQIYKEDVEYMARNHITKKDLKYSKDTEIFDLERLFVLDRNKFVQVNDNSNKDSKDKPFSIDDIDIF